MSEKNFKLGEKVFVDGSGIAGFAGNGWGGSMGVVTKETNHRGHVKIRLDKVPQTLKGAHNTIDGLWCYSNHTFYMKRQFKIGDEVFVNRNGVFGCNNAIWNGSKGVVTAEVNPAKNVIRVKLNRVPHGFSDLHDNLNGLWCKVENVYALEREKPKNEAPCPCELHLSFVGNATTMSLVDANGNVECSATARCHPNDDFDVGTGMKIAFERLYERYRKHNPDHSALMIGDKVRLKKGATLPLITRYGNSDDPSEIILNEAGVVKALSLNSKNAIVGWRENVVAVVTTSDLERSRDEFREPLYREGVVLITRKNHCPVQVCKDYYSGEGNVYFKTASGKRGNLPPEKFSGVRTEQNRVKVGDKVFARLGNKTILGIVDHVRPSEGDNADWLNYVTVSGVDLDTKMHTVTVGEEHVQRYVQRDAEIGDTVFVVNEGFSPLHRSDWSLWELAVANGKFCKVMDKYISNSERPLLVRYNGVYASVDPAYVIVLGK